MEDQMLQIGLVGMTIVLGLLFSKVGIFIARLPSPILGKNVELSKDIRYEIIAGIGIIATTLILLIGMILTILEAFYVHHFSYGPFYFLISMLAITLPLYISIECMSKSVEDIFSKKAEHIVGKPFKLGIIFLRIGFFALLIYLILVLTIEYFNLFKIYDTNKPIDPYVTFKFISTGILHVGGIIYTFIVIKKMHNPLFLLISSLVVFSGALIYLFLIWGVKLTIQTSITAMYY
ncbi:MAG: hypothetical protein ACFE8N_16005 [Promethearchaeota archaeon]